MKRELALQLLGKVMAWDDAQAEVEFKRLSLLERFKYDTYSEFVAGARFVENLARWLQQFEVADREVAYTFVKDRLLFVTNAELERLVESFFPTVVFYDVLAVVADFLNTPTFKALDGAEGQRLFNIEVRKSLFIGVSDGARTDLLRRFNVGRISNDQVLLTPDTSEDRWEDVLGDLRKWLNDDNAKFTRVYLLDDFTGSGTTFCQLKDEKWKGKLVRFYKSFCVGVEVGAITPDVPVFVHHYLATSKAAETLNHLLEAAAADLGAKSTWFPKPVRMTFGHILDRNIPLDDAADSAFIALCFKYYDKDIEKPEHGQVDLQLGYKNSRLPLVLQHNTPNNTVPLIWKESDGRKGHALRALFRRRERH